MGRGGEGRVVRGGEDGEGRGGEGRGVEEPRGSVPPLTDDR